MEGDGFGLDKAARLEAQRAAERSAGSAGSDRSDGSESLNPPWPWAVLPFDPGFWELTGNGA